MSTVIARQPATGRAALARSPAFWASVFGILAALCIFVLEARFDGIETADLRIGDTPVTLYHPATDAPAPPVVVAHGFAGSRQMMDQISVTLARQGFIVASVDLPGHGRNQTRLSPQITTLDGTTAQLTAVVEEVARAIAVRDDVAGPMSFVGHSMASDIVIRAAQALGDPGPVVAISMYSPAVTETSPRALLVLSGAQEEHLRDAGLEALRQIDLDATEGKTVSDGDVVRRSAIAPWVGHVGVLYAPASLDEIGTWLRDRTGQGRAAPLDRTGLVLAALFLTLTLLVWPLSKMVPRKPQPQSKPTLVSPKRFFTCLLLPLPAVLILALLPIFGIAGIAAFGTLTACLAGWGLIQLAVLTSAGVKIPRPDLFGLTVYLFAALAFALALDRYGAAFVPTGDRGLLVTVLLLGTLPVMLADTMLTQGAALWRRILARLALLIGLGSAMALSPTGLGLTFTVIPVTVLFFVVYGSMARWIAARRGAGAVGIGQAVILAYAIAASTPLFATGGAT
ncbi:MAG: alpha/beta fold hydrolase [Pseudomonadota bacterium]